MIRSAFVAFFLLVVGCATPRLSEDAFPPIAHTIVVSAEGPSVFVSGNEEAAFVRLGPGEGLAVRVEGDVDALVVAVEDEGAPGGGLSGPRVLRLNPDLPVGQLFAPSLSTFTPYELIVFACASREGAQCTDWRMVPPRRGEGPGIRLLVGMPEVDRQFAPDPPLDPDDTP